MAAQIISFNCTLKNKAGRFISFTINREVLTDIDAKPNMLAGLSKGLQDLAKGEKRMISVPAEEAYGFYDPAKVILYPRKKLPKHVRVGETISIAGKSGAIRSYKVSEMFDDYVSLDGNHPLAGQDLIFEIEVLDARPATQSEIDASVNPVNKQWLN